MVGSYGVCNNIRGCILSRRLVSDLMAKALSMHERVNHSAKARLCHDELLEPYVVTRSETRLHATY